MKTNNFKELLKQKMHEYVRFVYRATKGFPKDELYGVTSQFRRSTLSVILNYIEGYARRKPRSQLNFFEISYASLKESKYLLFFSKVEGYLTLEDYPSGLALADEIGAILWTEISALEESLDNKKHED